MHTKSESPQEEKRKEILKFHSLFTSLRLFQTLDYRRVYANMLKPAFAFDGRMILDHDNLVEIGFQVDTIGKVVKNSISPVTPPLPPGLDY